MQERPTVIVGIAAYNEENNIGQLLSALITQPEVDHIVVVSSSTDNTNSIVAGYASRRAPTVTLVVESERRGKSSACNTIIDEAQKGHFDFIVFVGGDNLPADGSIRALLDGFDDGKIRIVGGRPVPVDDPKTFLGWTSHLQWNMHHFISKDFYPKISGELMAFRAGVIKEIPIAVINDDAYMQLTAQAKGYEARYCPSATVKLKGCSSVKDLIMQRRRVYLGHLQALFLSGVKVSTFKWRLYHRILREALPSFGLKETFYLIGAVALQAWAYLLSLKDFYLFRIPSKWEMVQTTKERIGK